MENKDCMITLTIFSENKEFITYMATEYIKQMTKTLGYKVNHITCGKHTEANRPHYHIMYDVNIQKGKYYKTLNQTLIRKSTELEFPTKAIADEFRDTEIKISFIYDGQEKKHKKKVFVYGKTYMRYPFKEYNSYDKIEEDLQHGFSKEELEVMRKEAHREWLIVKEKQQREIANQIAEQDEFREFNQYLEQNMSVHKNSENSEDLIKRCMKNIWSFKKMKYDLGRCKTIRVASIQDQAISWLVFNNYISEDEIVNMYFRI